MCNCLFQGIATTFDYAVNVPFNTLMNDATPELEAINSMRKVDEMTLTFAPSHRELTPGEIVVRGVICNNRITDVYLKRFFKPLKLVTCSPSVIYRVRIRAWDFDIAHTSYDHTSFDEAFQKAQIKFQDVKEI